MFDSSRKRTYFCLLVLVKQKILCILLELSKFVQISVKIR